jgi:TRAP-type C4-dicarboxylate transport system substrate-binding protein
MKRFKRLQQAIETAGFYNTVGFNDDTRAFPSIPARRRHDVARRVDCAHLAELVGDHMRKVMDGPIGEEILKALEPHGLVGLAYYDSGARSFYNSKRAVTKPEDMKGLKIRVQQSDLFIALVSALGANATPMPFGEVFSALQTGVIDGAENNWPSYESTRHFEVSKFYSLTEHSMSPEVLVMSKRAWDKLSAEDQATMRKAAKESVVKMRELWEAREKSAEAAVKAKGAQVNSVEKQAFIDAMKPVYDKFVTNPKLKDLVARIQAVN